MTATSKEELLRRIVLMTKAILAEKYDVNASEELILKTLETAARSLAGTAKQIDRANAGEGTPSPILFSLADDVRGSAVVSDLSSAAFLSVETPELFQPLS